MKHLILIIYILIASYSQGQNSEKEKIHRSLPEVKVNFEKRHYITVPKNLREGDFYRVHVTNINLNRYQVIIEGSDTVYSKPLEFPVFGTIDLNSLSGLVSGTAENNKVAPLTQQVMTKIIGPQLNTKLDQGYNFLFDSVNTIISEIRSNLASSPTPAELIQAQLETANTSVALYHAELKLTKKAIDEMRYNYMAYRNSVLATVDPSQYTIDIKDDLQSYDVIRTELNKLNDLSVKRLKEYSSFLEESVIKVFLNDPANLLEKENANKTEKALQEATAKIGEALSMVSTDKIDALIRSSLYLYTDTNYVSLPLQMNGEQAIVDIRFVPKDSTSGLQHELISKITFPKRRWYWSVGASIYYSKLTNERLSSETVQVNDSTTRFRATKESDLSNEIGVAALLRAGYKIPKSGVGIHAAVGTGLSLGDEVQPRLLAGGGLTLGQKHSLAIDVGLIAGYVKRASINVDFEKDYINEPSLTVNDFDTSFFLSVGYAFRF